MDRSKIIEEFFDGTPFLVRGRQYPEPLPIEVARWYCYTSDGGHSVLALLDVEGGNYAADNPTWQQLCPVPVKTVLRDYRTNGDFVVAGRNCGATYSSDYGLRIPEGDDEF